MSRCLAEIGVIKQELIDKTNLLHASQEMIDNLRTDAEKMRQEFSNYDQMITNTKYETEVMRIHSNYLVSHNSNKLPQPKKYGLGGGLGEVGVPTDYLVAPVVNWTGLGCDNCV